MLNEYKKESRLLYQGILQRRIVRIPRQLKAEFYAFQKPRTFKYLLQVNLVAQFSYATYSVVDWFMLHDIGRLAIALKLLYASLMCLISCLIYKFGKSITFFDLMLPVSIIGAATLWFSLLNLSHSEDMIIYQYASLVFIVLANLCVQTRFIPALYISLMITAVIYAGVYQVVNADWHQFLLFILIYNPILVFSLYISWTSTQKSRTLFLHSKLDEINRQALDIMAHTDALTGLNNRRQFLQLAQQHVQKDQEYQQPMCLIMFDVDHFKKINDEYGHTVGDQVLQRIATLSTQVMRSEHVLARFGGEEFIVLLPNTPLEQAQKIAENLRQTMSQHVLNIDHNIKIRYTVSVGLAEFSLPYMDLHQVIDQADMALYRAKAYGRNQLQVYKNKMSA